MPNTDKALAELLSKLGVSIDKLWPGLLSFVKIDWLITMGTLLLLTLVSGGLFSYFRVLLNREDTDIDLEEGYTAGVILFGVISLFGLIISFIHLSGMSVLWFPEPYALKYLAGLK